MTLTTHLTGLTGFGVWIPRVVAFGMPNGDQVIGILDRASRLPAHRAVISRKEHFSAREVPARRRGVPRAGHAW